MGKDGNQKNIIGKHAKPEANIGHCQISIIKVFVKVINTIAHFMSK